MAFFQALSWHEGEDWMHKTLHVPSDLDNPTVPMLTQQAARTLGFAPLLAIGIVDANNRPWTSVWGGKPGFSQPVGQSIIGIRTPVEARYDPVVEALVGTEADGEVRREAAGGRMVGGLTIDLVSRKRVKLYGRMIAGALSTIKNNESGSELKDDTEIQLVVKVEQSLGNCPKYLNSKEISPAHAKPTMLSDSPILQSDALRCIENSDMFFISSSHAMDDMDTNHRGGPPGFVRVATNETSTFLVWPEFSGNRLYQTLGNLKVTPKAGLCFPQFETGDVLYLTGITEILAGADAANVLPRSNLAVKFTVTASRFVTKGLCFIGRPGKPSPYNPDVRYLKTERRSTQPSQNQVANTAKLLLQERLTPSISRFRFSLSNPQVYTAGQYVTLNASSHLDVGYSHMRDDDPRSINDDFVRTFTVSSPPGMPPRPSQNLQDNEFEITIRRVGPVTDFLFKHGLEADLHRIAPIEIDVKGFGGDFKMEQKNQDKIGFIAGGVGITPLLPCIHDLDPQRLRVLWAVRAADIRLVLDLLAREPQVGKSLRVCITGDSGNNNTVHESAEKIKQYGAEVMNRRLMADDFNDVNEADIKRWYVCTNGRMRKDILVWLDGKETIYEDFDY